MKQFSPDTQKRTSTKRATPEKRLKPLGFQESIDRVSSLARDIKVIFDRTKSFGADGRENAEIAQKTQEINGILFALSMENYFRFEQELNERTGGKSIEYKYAYLAENMGMLDEFFKKDSK